MLFSKHWSVYSNVLTFLGVRDILHVSSVSKTMQAKFADDVEKAVLRYLHDRYPETMKIFARTFRYGMKATLVARAVVTGCDLQLERSVSVQNLEPYSTLVCFNGGSHVLLSSIPADAEARNFSIGCNTGAMVDRCFEDFVISGGVSTSVGNVTYVYNAEVYVTETQALFDSRNMYQIECKAGVRSLKVIQDRADDFDFDLMSQRFLFMTGSMFMTTTPSGVTVIVTEALTDTTGHYAELYLWSEVKGFYYVDLVGYGHDCDIYAVVPLCGWYSIMLGRNNRNDVPGRSKVFLLDIEHIRITPLKEANGLTPVIMGETMVDRIGENIVVVDELVVWILQITSADVRDGVCRWRRICRTMDSVDPTETLKAPTSVFENKIRFLRPVDDRFEMMNLCVVKHAVFRQANRFRTNIPHQAVFDTLYVARIPYSPHPTVLCAQSKGRQLVARSGIHRTSHDIRFFAEGKVTLASKPDGSIVASSVVAETECTWEFSAFEVLD